MTESETASANRARGQREAVRRACEYGRIGALCALFLASTVASAAAQTYYYNEVDNPMDTQPIILGSPLPPPPAAAPLSQGLQTSTPGAFAPPAPRAPLMRRVPIASNAQRRFISRAGMAPSVYVSEQGPPSFGPSTAALTSQAAARYEKIVENGGWPVVPNPVGPGSRGPAVALLRRRLSIEGYLPASLDMAPTLDDAWTPDLSRAVERYQTNIGLRPTGAATGATLQALNVPASERVRQLASTATRLAGVNFSFGRIYVTVNIPAQAVEAVANGELAHRYVAVVGAPSHQSPQIAAHIQSILVNPTWTVPISIIKNEMLPQLRRDPALLIRQHFQVLDGGRALDPMKVDWRSPRALSYTIRQEAGPFDALGSLLINMPNKEEVYMHDTDERWLFQKSVRFVSHGCVRIDGVYDLAAWILRETGNPNWSARGLLDAVGGPTKSIPLSHSVPVIWVYMTGWADPDGNVHFRNDIYRLDGPPETMAHAEYPMVAR